MFLPRPLLIKSKILTVCPVKPGFPRKVSNYVILPIALIFLAPSSVRPQSYNINLRKCHLLPEQMSHLTGSQWQGEWERTEVGGKCWCTHTANYCRCLKLAQLFWIFLKQEVSEKWPTGNVPWRQKGLRFVLQGDSRQTFCKETGIIK